jgi:2-oxoglutarate ferredoxin oxidoreductase subunit alpha
MPTKTEQADLMQAIYGRNGESPVCVIAPATPSDCFEMAIEAWRLAIKYMTPVIFLSDLYLGVGSEPWRVPDYNKLEKISVTYASDPATFQPYARDERTLARPWAIPGTPHLEHRIGGLEKADITGNVSYEPANHDKMIHLRAAKVAKIAQDIPPTEVFGDESGGLLVLGWGSTYGVIRSAVQRARTDERRVSHAHIRYLNPLPPDLGDILKRYDSVLVPEINLGQLRLLVRGNYLVDAKGMNKVSGRPFTIAEIQARISDMTGETPRDVASAPSRRAAS